MQDGRLRGSWQAIAAEGGGMKSRYLIAGLLGCALVATVPALSGSAAGSEILLTTVMNGAAANYQLENFNDNEAKFSATTPFDHSADTLIGLANTGRPITNVYVTFAGQRFTYTNCTAKADVSASGSTANVKLNFTCEAYKLGPAPTPAPSPTPTLHFEQQIHPILVPNGMPTAKH